MKHNIFVICNMISIVVFAVIPIYCAFSPDLWYEEKVLIAFICAAIALILLEVLITKVRKHNKIL